MLAQKTAARAAWSGTGDAANLKVWFDIRDRVGPTEFLGYASANGSGHITALVVDGVEVEHVAVSSDAPGIKPLKGSGLRHALPEARSQKRPSPSRRTCPTDCIIVGCN